MMGNCSGGAEMGKAVFHFGCRFANAVETIETSVPREVTIADFCDKRKSGNGKIVEEEEEEEEEGEGLGAVRFIHVGDEVLFGVFGALSSSSCLSHSSSSCTTTTTTTTTPTTTGTCIDANVGRVLLLLLLLLLRTAMLSLWLEREIWAQEGTTTMLRRATVGDWRRYLHHRNQQQQQR